MADSRPAPLAGALGDGMTVPTLTPNNGVQLPALGFGVFQTPPMQTAGAVTTALETGYRHVDTAAAYGNERDVGRPSGAPDYLVTRSSSRRRPVPLGGTAP